MKKSFFRFLWVPPVFLMGATAVGKLIQAAPLVANFEKLDAVQWMIPLGIIQLTSTLLFLIPRTRTLGFFLLCGYLGGIIATRMLHDTMGIGIGLSVLLWAGMYFERPDLFQPRPAM